MLRIAKITDYSIVVLAHLAAADGELYPAAEIAEATQLPAPTVAKVLKSLTRRGFLVSRRGANGGYALARRPSEIGIAEVIEAVEGPISLTECSVSAHTCDNEGHCGIQAHWPVINRAVRTALAAVTLADISRRPPEPFCHTLLTEQTLRRT